MWFLFSMPLLVLFPLPEMPFSLRQTPAHPQGPGEVTFPPSLFLLSPPPQGDSYIMHTLVIINISCFRCLYIYPFLLLNSKLLTKESAFMEQSCVSLQRVSPFLDSVFRPLLLRVFPLAQAEVVSPCSAPFPISFPLSPLFLFGPVPLSAQLIWWMSSITFKT